LVLAGQGPFFFSGSRRIVAYCSRACVSLLGQRGGGAVSLCMSQGASGAVPMFSWVGHSAYRSMSVVVVSSYGSLLSGGGSCGGAAAAGMFRCVMAASGRMVVVSS
jgi:hypothetical protein